jgi:methyltransferase
MVRPNIILSIVSLAAALGIMLGELMLSRSNEQILRRRGAVEPGGDVYRALAWAYPMMFVAMAIEGAVTVPPTVAVRVLGVLVFLAAKTVKFWAMSTLGPRWTYRVLVPPDASLVTSGPYSWVRHPNYVAVFGEIAGFAMVVGAPLTGAISLVAFGALVRKRIRVEDKALGRGGSGI